MSLYLLLNRCRRLFSGLDIKIVYILLRRRNSSEIVLACWKSNVSALKVRWRRSARALAIAVIPWPMSVLEHRTCTFFYMLLYAKGKLLTLIILVCSSFRRPFLLFVKAFIILLSKNMFRSLFSVNLQVILSFPSFTKNKK